MGNGSLWLAGLLVNPSCYQSLDVIELDVLCDEGYDLLVAALACGGARGRAGLGRLRRRPPRHYRRAASRPHRVKGCDLLVKGRGKGEPCAGGGLAVRRELHF